MAKDHTWIAEDYPKATSTMYSYYHDIDFPAQAGDQLFLVISQMTISYMYLI